MRNKVVKSIRSLCLAAALAAPGLPAAGMGLNLEMRQVLPELNPIARDVYICFVCTLEQFDAIVPPAGWERAPARAQLFSSGIVLSVPDNGVPTSVDFVPEIPGNEFEYSARVLGASVLGLDPGLGFLALAQVQRDTRLTYDAGSVIHEVIDTEGQRYVLFTFDLVLSESTYDLLSVGSLAALGLPAGWTYESSVLAEDLVIDSGGLAQVFSQGSIASYQAYSVPEPGAAALVAIGLAGLVSRRRA